MSILIVLSNDQIYLDRKSISSDHNDIINILEAVKKKFKIYLYSKKSNKVRNFSISHFNNIKKINFKNLFELKKNFTIKVLVVSITPFNFLNYIILNFFYKNLDGFIYLRSDGYDEYRIKLGKIGFWIYNFMIKFLSKKLKIIKVSKNIISPRVDQILTPSELDDAWKLNHKKPNLEYPKLLYFGRFRKEKGIFSLIELSKNFHFKYKLTIAGDSKLIECNNDKIFFKKNIKQIKKIISLYDDHNLFILPSFTEGSPKVIIESLSRYRPVIVFKEIKYVKSNYKGIFVCERNAESLERKITFIMKNYYDIQDDIKKNVLPMKKDFQKNIIKILYESID